jgi:PAS domain S-box-containing protein
MTEDTELNADLNPKYSLTDLVSVEKLQQIQDAFAEANGVASTIVELNGTPITRPSNHTDVCKMIRATEKGMEKCKKSAEHLGIEVARIMKPFHKKCLSCGFSDAAAPILVNDHHIANWLIGQNHICDVDERQIREYSREIGADEEKMAAAFLNMNTISTDHFEKILECLWLIANEISNMGYLNLQQRRQTEELEKVQSQLEQHKLKLEQTVEERTKKLVEVNRELSSEIAHKDKMQKMQSRLAAAIENTSETIVITNTVPEILYVNPAFEHTTGYSKEEAIGKNPNVLNSGLHDKEFFSEMWRTIQNGEVWKGRLKNKNKKGEIYTEDGTISPVKDADGKIINYVAIKRDITQELEMERQLLQMSKMEAIGTLAAGIAHEINTPIQYVTDNTRFLEDVFSDYMELNKLYRRLHRSAVDKNIFDEQTELITTFEEEIDFEYLTEETGKAIGGALEGLDRIATVVKAMKEFSHPGGKEKEEEDINRLIESTVTVSTNEWKICADMNLELDNSLPRIPVYSGQMKQAVLNLIVNAAHAIAEKKSEDKGTITISTKLEGKNVKVVVRDTGTGIPEDIIEKVFDPFFTTKTVGKGTGQGLSLVHSVIIDGHGGTLHVDSTPGKGTEFIFTLPI